MENIRTKNCPVCNFSHCTIVSYIPMAVAEDPDLWTWDPEYKPKTALYRVECSKCGATTANMHFNLEEAIKAWNETVDVTGQRKVLMKYREVKL